MAVTTKKIAFVAELKEKLSASKGVVLTTYSGLTVAQDTKLRAKLRECGVEYRVVKNTMLRLAAKDAGVEGLEPYLNGTTAIAVSETDPVAPAKVIADFIKENKLQALEIKAGILEGKIIDVEGVKALANLPSREVLIAQVLAGMQSPIAGFVNVLQGTIRNVVYVLDAIRTQKQSA